jgi:hypothetical protein
LFPDGVGQPRHGLDIARHCRNALGRQAQAVDFYACRRIRAVVLVGRKDLSLPRMNRTGDRLERAIPHVARRLREHNRRRLRAGGFVDQFVCRYRCHSITKLFR